MNLFLATDSNILLNGVGEPFLEQNVRYHCPIYCVLNFSKTKLLSILEKFSYIKEAIIRLLKMICKAQTGIP